MPRLRKKVLVLLAVTVLSTNLWNAPAPAFAVLTSILHATLDL